MLSRHYSIIFLQTNKDACNMGKEIQPVLDIDYWKDRVSNCVYLRDSVYVCRHDEWVRHMDRHRAILAKVLQEGDTVLDAGCGYGRLVGLLPIYITEDRYLGIDLSPDLLKLAQGLYPNYRFFQHDIQNPIPPNIVGDKKYTWGVCLSLKYALVYNYSIEVWNKVEENLLKVCDKLLFLEFDVNEEPDYGIERA